MKYPFSGYVTCNGAYVEYKCKCVYKNVVPAKAIKATMDLCENIILTITLKVMIIFMSEIQKIQFIRHSQITGV